MVNLNCCERQNKIEEEIDSTWSQKGNQMANEKQIHVSRTPNRTWKVKRVNRSKAVRVLSTQEEAIKVARTIAANNGLHLALHRQNGQFRALDSRF